ncbi:integral membrane protein [Prochlorothrix hollandica PCC 9006 = CALU 1027]|uniref:Integral membrane protein n=1 Tax=Prochlorothrix hollandica PCC 9006 = CALU 1027 TaxID=317619 RepID=A0A0M2Q0Q8_PROHO|nr:integral membrane protein [Prochlorothrix hollandica PCC 9006 = CALU 1027]
MRYLLRRAAGGFLFGVPLLYTVELWVIGETTRPYWLLGALAIGFVVVFLLLQVEGLRRHQRPALGQSAIDTLEVLGVGVVCATLSLFLLRRITWITPLPEVLGKIVFEAIPFSFGSALASSLLGGDRRLFLGSLPATGDARSPAPPVPQPVPTPHPLDWGDTLADLDATLLGAFIIAFNIAPTDEVAILATDIPTLWLLVLMLTSLLISYIIVFVAGFPNQSERQHQQGLFQKPFSETIIAYLISLGAAVAMLWFFHKLGPTDPWQKWLSYTIVLGLPASMGGAAGRIIV